MKEFFKWMAGILEDKQGSASSKRVGFFWAWFLITYMVAKMTQGVAINMEMFWAIIAIILVAYGLITSEFLKGGKDES